MPCAHAHAIPCAIPVMWSGTASIARRPTTATLPSAANPSKKHIRFAAN